MRFLFNLGISAFYTCWVVSLWSSSFIYRLHFEDLTSSPRSSSSISFSANPRRTIRIRQVGFVVFVFFFPYRIDASISKWLSSLHLFINEMSSISYVQYVTRISTRIIFPLPFVLVMRIAVRESGLGNPRDVPHSPSFVWSCTSARSPWCRIYTSRRSDLFR